VVTVSVGAFVPVIQNSQEVTHETGLVGSEAGAERFVRTMSGLGDRLGPLLLQLSPSFGVEGMGVLEGSLERLPGGIRYAVEVRHRSWLGSDLPEMARELGIGLVLIYHPRMPRVGEAKAGFSHVRRLGDRRELSTGHAHPKKERDGDLRWWSGPIGGFFEGGKAAFAHANNRYQDHSPSALERFLGILRGAL